MSWFPIIVLFLILNISGLVVIAIAWIVEQQNPSLYLSLLIAMCIGALLLWYKSFY